MNRQGTALQIALIAGAVVIGILLDRLVLAALIPISAELRTPAREVDAAANSAIAAAKSSAPAATPKRALASSSSSSAGLDSILAERNTGQRLLDLQTYINGLTSTGFADALKRIRQMKNSNERELASRLLVARWVQTDPDGALQFAAGNRGYEYVAEDVFQQLAASDFDSAMSRALAIPGNDLRYQALRGILSFKADFDPRGALQLAQTLGDFPGFEPLSSVVYRQWATTDPQSAALAASQQTQAGDGEGWRSPVRPVVDTWAAQDPVAAANWSLALQDEQAQRRAIDQVMRQWARNDPTAAANWIYALEPGASRDAAVAGLAQSLAFSDPQTAIGWIGTITDEAARNRALQRISGTVMYRDPQNGAAILQAAGLPADQIRSGRGRRGGGGP